MATGGSKLIGTSGGGTLDGVTLRGDLELNVSGAEVTLVNGLTFHGTATLGGVESRLKASGTQTLTGTGSVVFGNATYAINKSASVGLELSHLHTSYKRQRSGDSLRAQLAFIYKF